MFHHEWFERLELLRNGHEIGPRGLLTREFTDLTFLVDDSAFNILDVPARKLNYRFMVAEWIWLMFGRSDLASLAQYNTVMSHFSDDGMFLMGAYGPHIKAQRARCLNKLQRDSASRQAVIQIPRPQIETKDEPCTLSFQYLLRSGRLDSIVTMRSSDIWLGIPYDVFTFTQLQNCFAGVLGVNRGRLTIHMGSSHLYDRDAPEASRVWETGATGHTLESPALPGYPPNWLDDVLLKRDESLVPSGSGDDPWLPYARVLLSRTSDDALAILKAYAPK